MSNYVTLMGAEGVERAGYTMRDAGDMMQRAANTIDGAMDRMTRALDEFADRMEALQQPAPAPLSGRAAAVVAAVEASREARRMAPAERGVVG